MLRWILNLLDRRTEREKKEEEVFLKQLREASKTHDIWVGPRGGVHSRKKKELL